MKFADIKDIAQKRNMNFTKGITDSSMVSLLDENCNYVEQVKFAKGILSFNGKNYRTLESINSLIDEMINVGNSKQYCAASYNPDLCKGWTVFYAIDDYAKKCGFTRKGVNSISKSDVTAYILTNMYGEVVTRIDVCIDDMDDTKGCITRSIGQFNWCEAKFNNIDECIEQFNSMAELELLANAAKAVLCVEKMNTARDYDAIEENTFDKNTGNIVKTTNAEYKAKVKKMLEDALASLG